MTDYSYLAKRLRIMADMIAMGEGIAFGSDSAIMREAADAIEAQAKRITRLEEMYTRWRDEPIKANNRIAELEAENAELERQIENYKAFLDGDEYFPQESPF